MAAERKIVKPPTRIPKVEIRLNFDADRFRWYFKGRDGLSLQEWRDKLDEEIRLENAKYSKTD